MKYIDTHSHLYDDKYTQEERKEVLEEMKKQDIWTVSISCDQKTCLQALALALENENIYASVGNHPFDNRKEKFDSEFYQKIVSQNKDQIVCVGECGLDYYYLKRQIKEGEITQQDFENDQKRQFEMFEQHIDFAVKNNLPLMLHVRSYKKQDAHKDALEILDKKQKEHNGKIKACFHFFTENRKIARQILERGYYISLPGVITFADLDLLVAELPLDKILSETDSPYAAPVPYRGKNNNPVYVKEVVKKIAEVKGLDQKECNEQLVKNAKNFFGI
ncbi:hypothetical protein CSB11_01475 [Candidatus Campbellbacteria bacterium]|nr:MAG: hypothetical protein CSB11_01475 [Candidatus Campbellbacteria bacterium]